MKEIENELLNGTFTAVESLSEEHIPDASGLYCIKLRTVADWPSKFGNVREDGIIYIGKASKSLRKRLWKQELNQKGHATFFRSIGAILGFLPQKSRSYSSRNYKFSKEDTEQIREWMRKSLLVNYITYAASDIESVERLLIKKYRPVVNIKDNPDANEALKEARDNCVKYAHS